MPARTSKPTDAEPAETNASPETEDDAPAGGVFEYIADFPTVYTPTGAPPQTAEKGDVCRLPFTPTDGRWRPAIGPVTRLPDPTRAPAVAPTAPTEDPKE